MNFAKISRESNILLSIEEYDQQPMSTVEYYFIATENYTGYEVGGRFDPVANLFFQKEKFQILEIIEITSNSQITVNLDLTEVTCPIGTVLAFKCELKNEEGRILDLDGEFITPLFKMAGGTVQDARYVKTIMTGGVVNISVPLPENGEWEVNEQGLNSRLPYEKMMRFKGVKIFVFDD